MENKFQEALKIALKEKQISYKQLSNSTGISGNIISFYVEGRIYPSLEDMIAIAKALDMKMDNFIENKELDKAKITD